MPFEVSKSAGGLLREWIPCVYHAKNFLWRLNGPINLYIGIKTYLLGASVAARFSPGVANIPIIGLVKMFGGNQGAEIGGGMLVDLSKNS